MKQIYFKLTLLSDIVLQTQSNTQGKNESKDFISGAVFLGVVAGHYDEFANPFEIFHSGKVCFGEAKPFINGKIAYKIPLCFFKSKDCNDFSEVYNALFCDFNALQDKQLRQICSGYINENLQKANLAYSYAQKVNLHAKDKSMFGYESIAKGAEFGFCVSFSEGVSQSDIDKITQILQGLHFIGKSKNAEYGEVLIESDFSSTKPSDFSDNFSDKSLLDSSVAYLYVASSLALFDSVTCLPTFEINAQNLGLESAKIAWNQTHIKTTTHTPYNHKRKSKDSARLVISQGSIIALTDLSQSDKEKLKNGKFFAGGFLSEGYGEILINPSFLLRGDKGQSFVLKHSEVDFAMSLDAKSNSITQAQNLPKDSVLIDYVRDLAKLQTSEIKNAEFVDNFIAENKGKFSKVTNAQWGAIRAFVQMIDSAILSEKIINYINEPRLEAKWSEGRKILENFVRQHDKNTIALLAMRMQKENLAKSEGAK